MGYILIRSDVIRSNVGFLFDGKQVIDEFINSSKYVFISFHD